MKSEKRPGQQANLTVRQRQLERAGRFATASEPNQRLLLLKLFHPQSVFQHRAAPIAADGYNISVPE
ncbi:MAG: hypothetical protein GY789_22270 [Hyphomicrobiales bacterium]|nr:hypothetical protein [Hyphomicrobiales bacterium]MCP5000180.1 hypothetical protein [Hyphomicrobiales bacterium]